MSKIKHYIYIIIVPFLLLSCTDIDVISNKNEKGIENNKIILTPEEYSSIAYDAPKELTEEEISDVVLNFRENIEIEKDISTRNSEISKVSIKKKYYVSDNEISVGIKTSTRSATNEKQTIPIFEVELSEKDGNKSLAVVCGDERIPEVFFYAENYHPDTEINNETRYLLELSKRNIFYDIQHIEYLKSTKRDSTLNKIAVDLNISKKDICFNNIKDCIVTTDEISTRNNNPGNHSGGQNRPQYNVVGYVNPLSKVAWTQLFPYNQAMPIMMIYDGYKGEYEGNIAVGCANVAVGILFSIVKPNMLLDNGQWVDWNYVTSVESIRAGSRPETSSPEDLIDMINNLLEQISSDTGSSPLFEEKTLIDIDNDIEYVKPVITQTTTPTINTINYLRNYTYFSGDINNKFNGNQAKQSLLERKPVFLCGSGHIVNNKGQIIRKAGGHAWLIDGVIITKLSRRPGYDHYWSVNMGWGAYSRSYFRTSDNLQNCDVVFSNGVEDENIAYYTQEMTMLYNITSK